MANRLDRVLCLVLATLGLLLSGCPDKQIIAKTPTVEDADDQTATCKVARDPLNPLIVEWPAAAKVDLETASRRGLVAVSYSGCVMKVLSACELKGDYNFEETTPARDRMEISDNNELYAKLPLGAASLKGELSAGASLELDYVAVGQRVALDEPKTRKGDCEGATHYVRSITVGAFKLDARAKGKAGASVEVGSAGGGIGREESSKKLRAQGDVEICLKKPSGSECGAILQLGLAPLAINKAGQVVGAGFGKGLAPIAVLPEIQDMGEVTLQGTTLADADEKFLRLVQLAKRADKQANIPARTKADAWDAVAVYKPSGGAKFQHPLQEVATERADTYRERAVQEEKQQEALDKLKTRYLEDKSKLDKLLALDDDVASKDEKLAWKAEFEQVYGTRKEELAMVGIGIGAKSNAGGKSAEIDKAAPEEKGQKGIAGFGKFSIELEAGFVGSSSSPFLIDGNPTRAARAFEEGGGGPTAGEVGTGNLMIGLMLATPELLPGGFGFYGAFRAVPGYAPSGTVVKNIILEGSAGLRWDYRVSPRGLFTVGAGGGYAFQPDTTRYVVGDESTVFVDESCTNPDATPNPECPLFVEVSPAGGMLDIFAGIGFSGDGLNFSFRGWFQALFLSASALDPSGTEIPLTFDSPLLFGGVGGTFGLTL